MTPEERARLQALKGLGTYSREQVAEYFRLLVKEAAEQTGLVEPEVKPQVEEVEKVEKIEVKKKKKAKK